MRFNFLQIYKNVRLQKNIITDQACLLFLFNNLTGVVGAEGSVTFCALFQLFSYGLYGLYRFFAFRLRGRKGKRPFCA